MCAIYSALTVFDLDPLDLQTAALPKWRTNCCKIVQQRSTRPRDHLWKTITAIRCELSEKILDEHISTSYYELIPFFPNIRIEFLEIYKKIEIIEDEVSASFLEDTQGDILELQGEHENYTSAMLGNYLRLTAIK